MKIFELRRHTIRCKLGRRKTGPRRESKHLSQDGIDLARNIPMGTYQGVITSKKSRAIETAIAFGLAVDVIDKDFGFYPEHIYRKSCWPEGFAAMSEAMKGHKSVAKYAQRQADLLAKHLGQIEEGQSILGLSHGGIMELMALGALPDADHSQWGEYLNYCEGFRLIQDDGQWVSIEFLRL